MRDETLSNETQSQEQMLKVPEKFIDPESGEIRLDALVKSYRAVETKLSQAPSA